MQVVHRSGTTELVSERAVAEKILFLFSAMKQIMDGLIIRIYYISQI